MQMLYTMSQNETRPLTLFGIKFINIAVISIILGTDNLHLVLKFKKIAYIYICRRVPAEPITIAIIMSLMKYCAVLSSVVYSFLHSF